jgi:predicted nucleotidyltransferase
MIERELRPAKLLTTFVMIDVSEEHIAYVVRLLDNANVSSSRISVTLMMKGYVPPKRRL